MGNPCLQRLLCLVALVCLAACDDGVTPSDAGPTDGETPTDGAEMCTRDVECGDTSLFCSRWRCVPSDPLADGRGCRDLGSECVGGQTCDEATDTCGSPSWCTEGREGCVRPGDCDGDGEDAMECGGDDCDDDDALRYPTATEVCDAEGVDEDCDPTTFGDRDDDADGFVDAACCNGATCGDDCDDDDINVNPGAAETCNGADDDCSGAADDPTGPASLCPGGTCTAGTCRIDGWVLSLGGPEIDTLAGVAIDDLGNVYVAGTMGSTIDPGPGSTAGRGGLVVAYDPMGVYRWHYEIPFRSEPVDIAVAAGVVYVSGLLYGEVDLGGGTRTSDGFFDGFLLGLTADAGAYQFDRTFPDRAHLDAASDGVVLATASSRDADLGDGLVSGPFTAVVKYDTAGAWVWQHVVASGLTVRALGAAADGRAVVTGAVDSGRLGRSVDFGGGVRSFAAFENRFYVLAVDGTGSYVFDYVAGTGQSSPNVAAISAAGAVFVGGGFSGTASFGGTSHTAGARDGFIFALTAAGVFDWDRVFGGSTEMFGGAYDTVNGMDYDDASARLLVGGSFEGTIDVGRAPRMNDSGHPDGFVAQYSGRSLVSEDYFHSAEGAVRVGDVSWGPLGTWAVAGSFAAPLTIGGERIVSRGGADGYVYRPGL